MQNRQQASQGNSPEQGEQSGVRVEQNVRQEELIQQVYLLSQGFTHDEARKLQYQRTHVYENVEMQQRLADDSRIHFARWLYEHGEISEK